MYDETFNIANVTGSLAAYAKLLEMGSTKLDFVSGTQWLSVIMDGHPTIFDNMAFIQMNGVQYFHDGKEFFAIREMDSDEVISLKSVEKYEVDMLFDHVYKIAEYMEEKTGFLISKISNNLL